MGEKNRSEIRSAEFERTEEILAELTPRMETFGASVYPIEEVQGDAEILENFKGSASYKEGNERSDAKILEKTFIDMAERGDWFSEDEQYGDDMEYIALTTLPTAEIDDAFNHIDLIATISNEATEHEVIPFAIDLTYNTDTEKMRKKFSWKHAYGKKEGAREGVSEYSLEVPLREKKGLKIPGFAAAKYYEDLNNAWEPVLPKGRIPVMPRFIVGYSPDLANILAQGAPTAETQAQYGNEEYQRRKDEFQAAEYCAKWCTLIECNAQAREMKKMLAGLGEAEVAKMDAVELETAKRQSAAMAKYFGRALRAAREQAEEDPKQEVARRYAEGDAVVEAIIEASRETYGGS